MLENILVMFSIVTKGKQIMVFVPNYLKMIFNAHFIHNVSWITIGLSFFRLDHAIDWNASFFGECPLTKTEWKFDLGRGCVDWNNIATIIIESKIIHKNIGNGYLKVSICHWMEYAFYGNNINL